MCLRVGRRAQNRLSRGHPSFMRNALDKYRSLSPSVKASFWFLFASIFQKSVLALSTPIFTRMLTLEEFSKYPLYQSWTSLFIVFATLNVFNYATAKGLVKFKGDEKRFISAVQGFTTTLTFVAFGVFCGIHAFLGGFTGLPFFIIIMMFVDIISQSAFAFWSYVERFALRYKALVAVSIVTGILSPGIAVSYILMSGNFGWDNSWSRIFGWVLATGSVGMALYMINLLKGRSFFVVEYWKYSLVYCVPLVPHFLSSMLLSRSGQIAVDRFSGSDSAALFALANSLSMLLIIINDALLKTLIPWTYQRMSDGAYERIKKPINFLVVLVAGASLLLALLAPEMIRIFAGESFGEAVYLIPPLASTVYFMFLFNIFANIEYYFEETKLVSVASMVAGILILVLNFILVPLFGYMAAGYAALACYVAYALMHWLFMRKALKKHLYGAAVYDMPFIGRLSGAFVLLMLATSLIYRYPPVRYCVLLALCAALAVKRKEIFAMLKNMKS